jgi:hypothetical protein
LVDTAQGVLKELKQQINALSNSGGSPGELAFMKSKASRAIDELIESVGSTAYAKPGMERAQYQAAIGALASADKCWWPHGQSRRILSTLHTAVAPPTNSDSKLNIVARDLSLLRRHCLRQKPTARRRSPADRQQWWATNSKYAYWRRSKRQRFAQVCLGRE